MELKQTALSSIGKLIAAAHAKADELETITKTDGSTFQMTRDYGAATEGRFKVFVITAQTRGTSSRPRERRVTYYLDGKRTNKIAFVRAAQEVVA